MPRGRDEAPVSCHGSYPQLWHQSLVMVQVQPQVHHGVSRVRTFDSKWVYVLTTLAVASHEEERHDFWSVSNFCCDVTCKINGLYVFPGALQTGRRNVNCVELLLLGVERVFPVWIRGSSSADLSTGSSAVPHLSPGPDRPWSSRSPEIQRQNPVMVRSETACSVILVEDFPLK